MEGDLSLEMACANTVLGSANFKKQAPSSFHSLLRGGKGVDPTGNRKARGKNKNHAYQITKWRGERKRT